MGSLKDSIESIKREIFIVGRTIQDQRRYWKRNIHAEECAESKRGALDMECSYVEKVLLLKDFKRNCNKGMLHSFPLP